MLMFTTHLILTLSVGMAVIAWWTVILFILFLITESNSQK